MHLSWVNAWIIDHKLHAQNWLVTFLVHLPDAFISTQCGQSQLIFVGRGFRARAGLFFRIGPPAAVVLGGAAVTAAGFGWFSGSFGVSGNGTVVPMFW